MTRFDEVTRLKGLEENAEPAPWTIKTPEHNDGYQETWIVGPGETGVMPIFDDEDDHLNVAMRNAAPWLLEALACFRPGDAEILRLMRNYLAAHKPDGHLLENGPSTACGVDCMARLLKAAEIMEGSE